MAVTGVTKRNGTFIYLFVYFFLFFFNFYFWNLKNIQNSVWALSRAEGETLEIFLNAMYIY